ncbi:MAG TPA: excalibur calcium-binding domain-containing protein [Solirubrobacterales bacterium]|nr:excalibur calcium-binding domain-containing protein [Solirubrobacterales bacterium]
MNSRIPLLIALTLVATASLALAPSPAAARDYDCADFDTQAEAQEYLLAGDPYRLDADNDGIACEDLPCPCSYGAPSEGGGGGNETAEPPPPPPYHLTKAAARRASRAIVAKFVRRSPRVTAGAVGACRRLAERRVDCQATARGRTGTAKTTCRLRVAVRAVDRRPKARLASVDCRTRDTVKLKARDAADAIRARGTELAGKRVGLGFLERRSRTSFLGTVEWTKTSSSTPVTKEECFALIEAALTSSGQVRAALIETGCEAVP